MPSYKVGSLVCLSLFIGSCGPKAPPQTLCFIDLKDQVLHCEGTIDKRPFTVTLIDAEKKNYLCEPLKEAQALRDYVISLERAVANCK